MKFLTICGSVFLFVGLNLLLQSSPLYGQKIEPPKKVSSTPTLHVNTTLYFLKVPKKGKPFVDSEKISVDIPKLDASNPTKETLGDWVEYKNKYSKPGAWKFSLNRLTYFKVLFAVYDAQLKENETSKTFSQEMKTEFRYTLDELATAINEDWGLIV